MSDEQVDVELKEEDVEVEVEDGGDGNSPKETLVAEQTGEINSEENELNSILPEIENTQEIPSKPNDREVEFQKINNRLERIEDILRKDFIKAIDDTDKKKLTVIQILLLIVSIIGYSAVLGFCLYTFIVELRMTLTEEVKFSESIEVIVPQEYDPDTYRILPVVYLCMDCDIAVDGCGDRLFVDYFVVRDVMWNEEEQLNRTRVTLNFENDENKKRKCVVVNQEWDGCFSLRTERAFGTFTTRIENSTSLLEVSNIYILLDYWGELYKEDEFGDWVNLTADSPELFQRWNYLMYANNAIFISENIHLPYSKEEVRTYDVMIDHILDVQDEFYSWNCELEPGYCVRNGRLEIIIDEVRRTYKGYKEKGFISIIGVLGGAWGTAYAVFSIIKVISQWGMHKIYADEHKEVLAKVIVITSKSILTFGVGENVGKKSNKEEYKEMIIRHLDKPTSSFFR